MVDGQGVRAGRIEYLDVLRVLSMVMVVFLHCSMNSLTSVLGAAVWHFSNVLTSVASVAVPLFFMISGSLLLRSKRTLDLGYTFTRRLPKILVPFLAWSVIAIGGAFLAKLVLFGRMDWSAAGGRFLDLPMEPAYYHLWYIYALIPLYVLSPVFKRVTDVLGRRALGWVLLAWLLIVSLLPSVAWLLPEQYRLFGVVRNVVSPMAVPGAAGYFIAGYYLAGLERRISAKMLASVCAAAALGIALGTWYLTRRAGTYDETLKAFTSPLAIVLAWAIFVLAKDLSRDRVFRGMLWRVVEFLAPLSFGIYLVHAFIIDAATRLLGASTTNTIPALVAFFVFVMVASVFLVWVLTLIKPFSYLLTGQRYEGLRRAPARFTGPSGVAPDVASAGGVDAAIITNSKTSSSSAE